MKENQRTALTKRLLQEGLLRLLEKKALEKISISELCNEAGINRATFYRHYEAPHDILRDMELKLIEGAYYASESNDTVKSSAEKLEALCIYLYDNSDLIKIFINNNSEEDLIGISNNLFQAIIGQKENLKELEGIDDDSLKLVLTYISGGGYALLRQWLTEDIQKTPKEITELVLSFLNKTYSLFEN